MKKLMLTAAFAVIGIALSAQHETLFGKARVLGGFGGPIVEFGIGNDLNTAVGGGGGIIISNFFLGGYGLGSLDFQKILDDDEVEQLDLGHGGFWLGYAYKPHKVVHLFTSTKIGWGALNIKFDDPNQEFSDLDQIFVVTPELGIELNVFRWFRVGATGGYRFVDGANEARGYTNDDFGGAIGTLTFRFGWFGWRRN